MKSLINYITENKTNERNIIAKLERNVIIDFDDTFKLNKDTLRINCDSAIRVIDTPISNRTEDIIRYGFGFTVILDLIGMLEEDEPGNKVTDYKLNVRFFDKKNTIEKLNNIDKLTLEGLKDSIILYIFEHLIDIANKNKFHCRLPMQDEIRKELNSILK